MPSREITFYFDFISPYAYFSWLRLQDFAKDHAVEIIPKPVVFGKLLDHWGQLGPAEIPPKRHLLYRYCVRYAALNGFQFAPPKYHPFNPLPALRIAQKEVSGSDQLSVISAIFEAGWSQGKDISDLSVLLEVIEKEGVDCSSYASRIQDVDVKAALKENTDNAIRQGVFGVPSFQIGEEVFWGNDQFDAMSMVLKGEDPFMEPGVKQAWTNERGIDRQTLQNKSR